MELPTDAHSGPDASKPEAASATVIPIPPAAVPADHQAHTDSTLLAMRIRHPALQGVRLAALLLFGLLLPTLLLWSAYGAISNLKTNAASAADLREVVKALPQPVQTFRQGNDYSLLFAVFADIGEYRQMVNRMQMKTAVMHVGFAIACVGLLLMVLGIDAGPLELGAGTKEAFVLNMKAASSGIAVFVLGAGLAGAAGLMPMQHQAATAEFLLGSMQEAPTQQLDPLVEQLQKALAGCGSQEAQFRVQCRVATLQAAERLQSQLAVR